MSVCYVHGMVIVCLAMLSVNAFVLYGADVTVTSIYTQHEVLSDFICLPAAICWESIETHINFGSAV